MPKKCRVCGKPVKTVNERLTRLEDRTRMTHNMVGLAFIAGVIISALFSLLVYVSVMKPLPP